MGCWLADVVGALRESLNVLGAARAARRIHEFADAVNDAREPEEIETALLHAAGSITGACRVELMLDRDQQDNPDPRLIGFWPESAATLADQEIEALGYPLCLSLWCGDHYQMTMQVFPRPGRRNQGWSPRIVRRLKTLCAMAAAAERGLHASQRGRLEAPVEMAAAVRDATFLNAILPYALAQAHRHRESLTVFCLELDAMPALLRQHGDERIGGLVARIADATARTLRVSDVVARLDDDRIIVVLPNTGGADALTVAGVVRSAVRWICDPNESGLKDLSVSIGLACFPIDGSDMLVLLNLADEAMNVARSRGSNQVATTAAVPPVIPEPRGQAAAPAEVETLPA